MSGNWFARNRAYLVRDLVRDYCLVYQTLARQRERFARDVSVSFAAMRELLGSESQKGVFWRLKDNTHHFFRHGLFHADMLETPPSPADGPDSAAGLLLDWCVGHAFHECWKLMEDAYQHSHYACYLAQLVDGSPDPTLAEPLERIVGQTTESMQRELGRIFHVLDHGRLLLTRFLATESENGHLARFLVREEALVREVFANDYAALLDSVCDGQLGHLHVLAAQDLARVGRQREAVTLLREAGAVLDDAGRELLRSLSSA